MVDIFADYTQKISPTGRQGWADCMSSFVLDTFKDAMEYEEVKLYENDTISSILYDAWIYSEKSYKEGVPTKTLLFSPLMASNTHDVIRGRYVRPQRQLGLWMITNHDKQYLEKIKCEIKLCTQELKWINQYGVLTIVPVVVMDKFTGTSVDFDQTINIPKGDLTAIVPLNSKTNEIKINDRFIFNGQPFKIQGINKFINNEINEPDFASNMTITFYYDQKAEGDDLINNIPVSNINYTISLNTNTISQSIGYTSQLVATVKRNGEVYSTPITWTSSDASVSTVDNNGNVSLVSNGSCVISAKMTENNSVVANCNVTVQAVPTNVKEVRISPNVTELLQSQTQVYTCNLYVNGVLTPSTFSFVGSGATNDKYVLTTISGNSFSIKNVKMSSVNLIVNATNGTDSGSISIRLRGAF